MSISRHGIADKAMTYRRSVEVGDFVCGGHRMKEPIRGKIVAIRRIWYIIQRDDGIVVELTRSEFRKSANRKKWTWL